MLPKSKNREGYFEFDLVQPLLTHEEARMCLLEFVSTVKDVTSYLPDNYGDSAMYWTPSTFPSGADHSNVDWRQFGIMLCFYLEDHHTEPTQQNHFLKELVDKGVYNEAFREDWVQSRRRNRVCKSELEFKLLIIPKKKH